MTLQRIKVINKPETHRHSIWWLLELRSLKHRGLLWIIRHSLHWGRSWKTGRHIGFTQQNNPTMQCQRTLFIVGINRSSSVELVMFGKVRLAFVRGSLSFRVRWQGTRWKQIDKEEECWNILVSVRREIYKIGIAVADVEEWRLHWFVW